MIERTPLKNEIEYSTINGGEGSFLPLPADRLEKVSTWGGASQSMGYVYRPSTIESLRDVFTTAQLSGRSIGLRGAGNSYGDATFNSENIVLDMQRMNRILEWDPKAGRIKVEPGVTIAQIWQYVIGDGWWPSVVPGTAKPTIGGCAGMNVHGKNAWKAGTIGEHIYEFDLMLPSGETINCSREKNHDLFYAAIGGFGMLGTFISLTLNLRRIYSGLLKVEALACSNLKEMMGLFEELLPTSDYLVGWIDAFAKGKSLGRGQIHKANYLPPGSDSNTQKTLQLDYQHLPETIFGIVPRSIVWRFMSPFMNNTGARFVNIGKYWTSRYGHGSVFHQPHVAFHFLLDYIPNWKKSYGNDGLIQYQSFVPTNNALDTFGEMLRICQKRGLQNYLTVLKRHKSDDFLISHGLDGYSMAMDFKITPRRRPEIVKLASELDSLVLSAGGKFYFAKDSTLHSKEVSKYLGEESIKKFFDLKYQYDPEGRLQTNLWRRLFPDWSPLS